MAKNNSTSAFAWLGCTLWELGQWVQANNRIVEREGQRREEARPPQGGRR